MLLKKYTKEIFRAKCNPSFQSVHCIAFFLLFYGVMRFFLEFFREPDAHLGFILGPLTMGQLLSAAMVGAGTLMAIFLYRRNTSSGA